MLKSYFFLVTFLFLTCDCNISNFSLSNISKFDIIPNNILGDGCKLFFTLSYKFR